MEVIFIVAIVIIVFAVISISNNKAKTANVRFADSAPENQLRSRNLEKEDEKGMIGVVEDDDVDERLYGMMESIRKGEPVKRDRLPKIENNIASSFMSMRMLKPLDRETNDLSFLCLRDGLSDFCAMSVKRLENYNASSYRIALVKVKDGQISDSCQLDYRPIKLTKKLQKELGQEKTDSIMSKPEFSEVWPEIKHYFESQVVVTYDEGYDMSVISTLFNHYNIEYEPLCFLVAISKTHKRLKFLLEELNITIEDDDCLSLAKLVAEIQLSDAESDYLGLLKKKFWGKL